MKIALIQGDITTQHTDAIVNAANSSLLGGGGVDGAIHRKGGPAILEACKKIRAKQGKCPPGEAVITTAGELTASYVIHTVGPVWQGGQAGEPDLLASCYLRSLELAEKHSLTSIAFPNISTGVYGYPKESAAKIAVETVQGFSAQASHVKEVLFVCFDPDNYFLYEKLLQG